VILDRDIRRSPRSFPQSNEVCRLSDAFAARLQPNDVLAAGEDNAADRDHLVAHSGGQDRKEYTLLCAMNLLDLV
jgi:hypothetical protein